MKYILLTILFLPLTVSAGGYQKPKKAPICEPKQGYERPDISIDDHRIPAIHNPAPVATTPRDGRSQSPNSIPNTVGAGSDKVVGQVLGGGIVYGCMDRNALNYSRDALMPSDLLGKCQYQAELELPIYQQLLDAYQQLKALRELLDGMIGERAARHVLYKG